MDLARNRVSIERKNLALVCSLSVKTLIDKSCYMTLDEQSEEFLNFSIILEHVFNHQFKPRVSWYRGKDVGGVWDYVNRACKSVPDNCLSNLSNFEHIKTGHGKVRAWVRVSLMEKRLSEYISAAISQRDLTGQFYGDGALLLSEEADLLTKSLLGLNAIDFSFDLKSANLDRRGCTVIDYSPYLFFTQCPESVVEDARELRSLSVSSRDESSACTPDGQLPEFGVERGSPDGKAPDTPQNTPNVVVPNCLGGNDSDDACSNDQYRTIVQQKGYLEELLRLRESQLRAEKLERRALTARLVRWEGEKARDMHQMETVVIELQAQLQTLKNDYHRLQRHVIMTSQGRKSSVPRFRYSARDQRIHSFSSDTDNQVPTAEEAAMLLPPESAEPSGERRRSPARDIDCELVAPEPTSPAVVSSSAESRDDPVTMNVEAEIHRNSCGSEDEAPHTDSPIAELLAAKKGYYNLGADVDRDSSEDRNARGSSEEHEEHRATYTPSPSDVFPGKNDVEKDSSEDRNARGSSEEHEEHRATYTPSPSDVFPEKVDTDKESSEGRNARGSSEEHEEHNRVEEHRATYTPSPSDVFPENTDADRDISEDRNALSSSEEHQESNAVTTTIDEENTTITNSTEDLLNGNSGDDNRLSVNSAEKDENCNDSLHATRSKANENESVEGNADNGIAVSD